MEKDVESLPLISIIVPVYNGEKYLRECIESILNQDYKNIELILINDGSKDSSKEIIDEYAKKDERVKAINQENSGVSKSRNAALNIAKGEFVAFIDQDDCIVENYLSYFYDLIVKNNVEIAITPDANRFVGNCNTNRIDTQDDRVKILTGEMAASEMLYYNIIIGPWNKIISRSLIEKNNLRFNPDFFGGEGFSFSVDCFQRANKVAVGHKKVYLYRVDNSNSGTTKFSLDMIKSNINAQKYIKENLVKQTPILLNSCRYANWHTHCDCLNTMIGANVVDKYPEVYSELKKICKKDALCVLNSPIPIKDKMKGILYYINPVLASKIINQFQIKKFTIEQEEK